MAVFCIDDLMSADEALEMLSDDLKVPDELST